VGKGYVPWHRPCGVDVRCPARCSLICLHPPASDMAFFLPSFPGFIFGHFSSVPATGSRSSWAIAPHPLPVTPRRRTLFWLDGTWETAVASSNLFNSQGWTRSTGR
jgi:hypothetical protein